MNIVSWLFKAARLGATIRAMRSLKTLTRRTKNILVGRGLGRLGLWKKIWK